MKVGIVSDSHNNRNHILQAAGILRNSGINCLFHCGDLTNDQLLKVFTDFRIFFSFGNADFLTGSIESTVKELHIEAQAARSLDICLHGKRIFVTHGDHASVLAEAKESEIFDYIFHGHTHEYSDQKYKNCRIINPGALGGNKGVYGFAVLDLGTDILEHYYVE